jgi:hypothetical protein
MQGMRPQNPAEATQPFCRPQRRIDGRRPQDASGQGHILLPDGRMPVSAAEAVEKKKKENECFFRT